MNWIKEKFKKTWKWIAGIFVLGALAMNIPPQGAVPTALETAENCVKNKTIDECIVSLDGKDKAKFKGEQIAKLGSIPKQNVKYSGGDYDIEIVSFNAIEKGVEVFARAWNPGGQQIGFGIDGTVDIERFVIINPPILIEDVNGNITRIINDPKGNFLGNRRYQEDPKLAILKTLSHIIKVKKQKFGNDKIIQNKIGNTTLTVYPDVNVGSTTTDACPASLNDPATWATITSDAGNENDCDPTSATLYSPYTEGSVTSNRWRRHGRGMMTFDTSSIGADTINSATLSIYGNAVDNSPAYIDKVNIYSADPANYADITTTDYQTAGTTTFSTGITPASFSTAAYNDYALNASGIANIDGAGLSGFTSTSEYDGSRGGGPTWVDNNAAAIFIYSADQAGTANDPKLVVEHSAGGGGGGNRRRITEQ